MPDHTIPKNLLRNGALYRVKARNGPVALWLDGEFIVLHVGGYERELHWHDCAQHGTVKPLEEVTMRVVEMML